MIYEQYVEQPWVVITELEPLGNSYLKDEPEQDKTILPESSDQALEPHDSTAESEPVTEIGPEQTSEVSTTSPADFQLAKNLNTVSRRIKHPVLKQLVEGYREGLRRKSPLAFAVGVALRQSIENVIPSRQSKTEQATRQLVGLFGKNGQYSGQTFNYDTRARGVKISLKDGTPAYERGKLNPELSQSQKELIKKLPERVKAAKAELKRAKTAHKSISEEKTLERVQ